MGLRESACVKSEFRTSTMARSCLSLPTTDDDPAALVSVATWQPPLTRTSRTGAHAGAEEHRGEQRRAEARSQVRRRRAGRCGSEVRVTTGIERADRQVDDRGHGHSMAVEDLLELRAVAIPPGSGVERKDKPADRAKEAAGPPHGGASRAARSTR